MSHAYRTDNHIRLIDKFLLTSNLFALSLLMLNNDA